MHAGRKNQELQINEHQTKHKVKLYRTSILPLLGLILNEYCEDICSKQNLEFDKSLFVNDYSSLMRKILNLLPDKMAKSIITKRVLSIRRF